MNRKTFLKNTAILSVVAALSHKTALSGGTAPNPYAFIKNEQSPLPYGYAGLEPVISSQIMELHYSKHAAGYLKNLKNYLNNKNITNADLTQMIQAPIDSDLLRNNLGGHFNHELFWKFMTPKAPSIHAKLNDRIIKDFGSVDSFKTEFANAGKTLFGSGWSWLCVDPNDNTLFITTSANQNNPMMTSEARFGFPILGIDVWEHAYYLQYQNKRADYVDRFWEIVNWDFVGNLYTKIIS